MKRNLISHLCLALVLAAGCVGQGTLPQANGDVSKADHIDLTGSYQLAENEGAVRPFQTLQLNGDGSYVATYPGCAQGTGPFHCQSIAAPEKGTYKVIDVQASKLAIGAPRLEQLVFDSSLGGETTLDFSLDSDQLTLWVSGADFVMQRQAEAQAPAVAGQYSLDHNNGFDRPLGTLNLNDDGSYTATVPCQSHGALACNSIMLEQGTYSVVDATDPAALHLIAFTPSNGKEYGLAYSLDGDTLTLGAGGLLDPSQPSFVLVRR